MDGSLISIGLGALSALKVFNANRDTINFLHRASSVRSIDVLHYFQHHFECRKPVIEVHPHRSIAQGSTALLTVKLPPCSFLTHHVLRALDRFLLNPKLSPVEASFQGRPLAVFPSLNSPSEVFHAFVPSTANDKAPNWTDLRVHTYDSLGLESATYLLPLQVTPRAFSSEDLWIDRNAPSTSPSAMGDFERRSIAAAIHSAVSSAQAPARPKLTPFYPPCNATVGTKYGTRRRYNGSEVKGYFHEGIDLRGDFGDSVQAPSEGRVVLVGTERQGFSVHGNVVAIDHGKGFVSILAHLGDVCVSEGDRVDSGQTVGVVGSSGLSTGPHLHWGLYASGRAVDPELHLIGPQGNERAVAVSDSDPSVAGGWHWRKQLGIGQGVKPQPPKS